LRFDFSHPKALTREELEKVEAWVNERILRAVARETKVMAPDEAIKEGAIALFGEKYGDEVRVVRFGNESVELCGGTHVDNTAQIGTFLIVKESGVSAGVRRIEAVCGRAALERVLGMRRELETIKNELKAQDALAGIGKLREEIKTLKSELKAALNATKKELKPTKIGGVHVIVDVVEAGDIKAMIDDAKNAYEHVAIMLFQPKGDKVLIAAGSKGNAIKAGDWIKLVAPVLGGGGGGRPDFAQAGGKDAGKIPQAIEEAKTYVAEVLEGGN